MDLEKKKSGGFFHFIAELSVIQSIALTAIAVLFPTFKNVDLLSQIRSWDFDGLFLYQSGFALLAAFAAFSIVYMISVLATSDKACSFVKRYIFYVLTFFMIYLFSVSLREFYAPTSSFTSWLLGKEIKVNYGLVQVESGVEFEALTCSKSGRLIKCNLDVKNTTEDDLNVTRFDRVSLYDQSNSKGKLEKVVFDGSSVGRWDKIHLTKKSTTSLSIYFNMPEKSLSELVKKLEINLHYFGNNRLVTFRNLDLTSNGLTN